MIHSIREFVGSILYCLKVAWNSSKGYTLIRLAGNFLVPLISMISSYIVKIILDLLVPMGQGEDNPLPHIVFLLIAALFMTLFSNLSQRFTTHAMTIHNTMIQNHLSLVILDRAISSDLSLYDDAQFYDKFTAVRNDSFSMANILWSVLDCISAIFSLASAFVILSQQNFWYALCITVLIIPTTAVNQYYTRKIYLNDLEQTNNERKRDYLFLVGSSKQYAQEIRCWDLGKFLKDKYLLLWEIILQKKKKLSLHQTAAVFLLSILPEVAVCIMSVQIAAQVLSQMLTVGDYSFYTGMMAQILGSTMLFVTHMIAVYDNKLKIENMKNFGKNYTRTIVSGTRPLEHIGKIEFRDVSFRYPGTEKMVLEHVSFSLQNHNTVVLVGKNGSGKSTLIKLLLRLYDTTTGTVLINDCDIREYRLEDLHKCFGVYFQNSPNFSFTVLENIILNRENDQVAIERIRKLFAECDADDLLRACHNDLNTYLTRIFSEDGIELSEGQHQKIAIVRALYPDTSCLVLDEPSSSLDPEAEHKIFESLYKAAQGKLALLTSHRLSNIYLADRIIVLENGHIIEEGSRQELLQNKDGRFAELYEYQAQKFREP